MSQVLIPSTWYTPQHKQPVIELLAHLPIDSVEKARILNDWAAKSNVTLQRSDYQTAGAVSQIGPES